MSFLDDILLFTSEYECPQRFYYWAGLSSISAILKDNVYLNMADAYTLYPNIFVLLYGPSGVRKGPAIAMAEKLVRKTNNTRLINGRASIEAIIKELGTFKTKPDKTMDKDSSGFIVASELSASIIANPSAMTIMTNLYDRIWNTEDWDYKLKVGESVKLIRPTITWLAASNEALFKEFIPEQNVLGGLIGRFFIINETKKNTINSLMYAPKYPLNDKAYGKLVDQLTPLKQLRGEFSVDDITRAAIDKWYHVFEKTKAESLNDNTGFVARMEDFVIKVAMLISCGRRADMIINIDDLEEAMTAVIPLLEPISKMVHANQKEDKSVVAKRGMMLRYLVNHETCGRKQLLRDLGLQIKVTDLDEFVNDLFAMDALNQSRVGNEIIYAINRKHPAILEWMRNFS